MDTSMLNADMLNAALPYLSGQMRKSLILYMKSRELYHLFSDYHQEQILSACSTEQNPPDPEAMLQAMKLAGGPNTGPQIDQILQMMNLIKTYQKINEWMQNNPEMIQLLTNLMNQKSNLNPGSKNPYSNTSDLLKQFGNSDSSDMMTLLTQMLKNSR